MSEHDDETPDGGENSGQETAGSVVGDSEWEECKICETATKDMSAHIESKHLDDLGAVQEYYDDRFDSIIEEEMDFENEYRARGRTESHTSTESEASQSSGSSESTSGGDPDEDIGTSTYSEDSEITLSGEKWYLIGVGGAGNRIADSILHRRESLKDKSHPLSSVWESALTGFSMLNSNRGDLTNTVFYQEMNPDIDRNNLINNNMIGVGHAENDYTGCGRDWSLGKEFIENDFEDDDNPIRDASGYDIEPDKLVQSQAVMITTSVTGGTGCGAAPVLARKIKNLDMGKNKTVLGSVILPSEEKGEDGPIIRSNGCTGAARMSRFTDAIMVFENDKLEEANPELDQIEGLERYPKYEDKNNAITKYFEIFSMASIDDPKVRGDDFDINDALRPINRRRPQDDSIYKNGDTGLDEDAKEFDQPGLVLAPVIARSAASDMNTTSLEGLAERALENNKLADFDPATAWGGTFVFFGPENKLDGQLIDNEFTSLVEERYLDKPDGFTYVDTDVKAIHVDMLDSVYLWGFLWNPEVRSLEKMYESAEKVKEGNRDISKSVEGVWGTVEGMFKLLGRQNLEGD